MRYRRSFGRRSNFLKSKRSFRKTSHVYHKMNHPKRMGWCL